MDPSQSGTHHPRLLPRTQLQRRPSLPNPCLLASCTPPGRPTGLGPQALTLPSCCFLAPEGSPGLWCCPQSSRSWWWWRFCLWCGEPGRRRGASGCARQLSQWRSEAQGACFPCSHGAVWEKTKSNYYTPFAFRVSVGTVPQGSEKLLGSRRKPGLTAPAPGRTEN